MSSVRLIGVLSLLVAAAAAAKPLRVGHVGGDGVGVAYWSHAGEWFLVQSRDGESLVKYSRDGRSIGRTSLERAHREVMFDLSASSEHWRHGPALSPDDKTLLFVDGAALLWRLDVASGKVARVNDRPGGVDTLWLADGKRAFVTRFDDASGLHYELTDVFTGAVERTCGWPWRIGAELLDDEHIIVLGNRLYAAGLDCREPLALTLHDDDERGVPIAVALSPNRRQLAVVLAPAMPTPGSRVSLWIYSRPSGTWTAALRNAFISRSLAWLDDDVVIFEELQGPDGSDSGTLQRYSLAQRELSPVLPPVAGCVEAGLSAPRNGGVVTFQRECVNQDGWLGIVRR